MDDGLFLPLPIGLVDIKPLKELPPPLKERLQGGNGKRFPESSRTRHEEEFRVAIRDKTMDVHRLVYIDLPVPAQRREISSVCGYRSHCRVLYHKSAQGNKKGSSEFLVKEHE